jgi:hypothetical protein
VVQAGVKYVVKIVKSKYVDCELEINGRECLRQMILCSTISEEIRGLALFEQSISTCRGSVQTAQTGIPFVQTFELIC